jgi:hypothetical protein
VSGSWPSWTGGRWGDLEDQSRAVLAQVPHAADWAARFTSAAPASVTSAKHFGWQAAPSIVRNAAQGIAQTCVPDPDGMLRTMLVQAIDACAARAHREPNCDAELNPAMWAAACRRTGGFSIMETTRPDTLARR